MCVCRIIKCFYDLDPNCPLTGSYVQGWSFWKVISSWGAELAIRTRGSAEGHGSLGVCLWRVHLTLWLPCSFCFLAALKWAAFFCHALLPWCFCLGFSQPLTETSETMNQNKSFFLKCMYQVFCSSNAKVIRYICPFSLLYQSIWSWVNLWGKYIYLAHSF